jgi:siroheme synthase-like protein
MEHNQNNLFPVFFKLEELRVLLVGGGYVGLEKLKAILSNSPETKLQIVAGFISEEINEIAKNSPNITLINRDFLPSDLDRIDLVIVGINNKLVSSEIYKLSREKGILINVADTPELCNFYLGSVVQKGNIKIAVSTNGKSPTMAKRIKEVLYKAIPDELNISIENLNLLRLNMPKDFEQKVKRLNKLTSGLVESNNKEFNWKKIASRLVISFGLMLTGHFLFSIFPLNDVYTSSMNLIQSLDSNFPWMVLAGFLAQLVDGALGMGYGVTSATILLSAGISLPAISGSIHTAEMFASGASGYSHYKFGNVNHKLFKALVIPGVIGAILGAILLSYFGDTQARYLKPLMATYTLFLGIRIISNAFRKQTTAKKFKRYGWLAWIGGFLDSFGGGGWGPIVTTTLITKGRNPKYVIGSVSLTEFFVTLASAFTFFTILGISHWQVIVALIIGGLIAAPIAAKLVGLLPRKASFILLGTLVIIWSMRILVNVF